MKSIDLKTIRLLCSREVYEEAGKFLTIKKSKHIELAADETVKASVELDGIKYPVLIRKNEERNFDTSSTYPDTDHPLCLAQSDFISPVITGTWILLFRQHPELG